MRVLVVGAGAMGRWFADSVATSADEVTFADVDREAARTATDAVGGSVLAADDDATFDLVCIAVPMGASGSAIAEYADRAERALCDVVGTMREPVSAMRTHAPDRERLSLHPLFAPERAPGNVAAVVDRAGPVTDRVRDRLVARGNDVVETTAEEHDRAMETVQARAHTAVLAFALAAEDVPQYFQTPVSAALFDLVGQVTAGDPHVYADIQDAFEGADDVARAAAEIAAADQEGFVEIYERLAAGERNP